MKRAVVYLRVSSVGQTKRAETEEGYSIEAQREACYRKAEELGAEVAGEYVDAAQSAKSADRAELQRMVGELADGEIDFVIVHKVDRLARSRRDDVALSLAIEQAGAKLVSVTENIDETPTGLLLHGIMASVAEFYSRNLATEIMKGTVAKAKRGGTPTRAPLGYRHVQRWDERRDIRTIEIDEERAPHIQWAFRAYATGEWSLDALEDELWERGLRSRPTPTRPPGRVRRSVIARLLHNPYYIGVVRYRGVDYEGKHPKLISEELFEQVQAVLAARDVAGEKQRRHPHYLKGTIFCGHCGRRFLYQKAIGRRGGIYWYFMCAGRHQGSGCPQPYIPAELAEAEVARYYGRTVKLRAERIAGLKDDLVAGFDELAKHRQREAARHQKAIGKLNEERRKLLQAHLAGAVPLDLLQDEQARVGRELATAHAKLEQAEQEVGQVKEGLELALRLAADAEAAYALADDLTKRRWNQAFFKKIFLRDLETSGAELADPFAQLLADDLAQELERISADSRSGGSIENQLLEAGGIEPPTPACKAGVFPLAPRPRLRAG